MSVANKIIDEFAILCNGIKMPRVGFGTWQLKNKDCYESVIHALKTGYLLIDTASAYENEDTIKNALLKYKEDNKNISLSSSIETGNEYNIFITSKANTKEIGLEATYNACIRTLDRLGIQKLDLYLLHWPGAADIEKDDKKNRQRRHEAWQAMEKLYKENKVRSIGVSNYLVKHLNELLEDGVTIKPMVDQIEYHPLCQNEELIKWAAEHNMQLQAYSSLGIGNSTLLNNPTVLEVSNKINKTPAQVLLRWGLQKNLCVIPRSKTLSRIEENFNITNFSLDEEEMNKLSSIKEKQRFCWDPTTVV